MVLLRVEEREQSAEVVQWILDACDVSVRQIMIDRRRKWRYI